MIGETWKIEKLDLERGLKLKSFKFKRLYGITLQDTVKSFPNFMHFVPSAGIIDINSDLPHVNKVISECIEKMRDGVALQVVNKPQSKNF